MLYKFKKIFKLSDDELKLLKYELGDDDKIYTYLSIIQKIIDYFPKPYITSSSGSSTVFISDQSDIVFQFYNKEGFERTYNSYNKIYNYKAIDLKIDDGNYGEIIYSYDIKDCISSVIGTNTTNKLFIWDKIDIYKNNAKYGLDNDDEDILEKFIKKNYIKYLWNMIKAINGLKVIGVSQNDCTIDNTAIYNGNFIIYDFDASIVYNSNEFKYVNNDTKTLSKSLNFIHINSSLNVDDFIYHLIKDLDNKVYNKANIIAKIKELDNLNIIHI